MSFATDEVYGTSDQQAMLRRGRALHDTLGPDPRFTYYGRTVGIARPQDADIDMLERLAFLQGASHFAAVPQQQVASVATRIAERGLSVTLYPRWTGQHQALAAARAVLAATPLPADLSTVTITERSPASDLDRLAEVAAVSGVLLPSGAVMRGQLKPGLAIIAVDRTGRAVSCAGAASFHHPEHPTLGGQSWWGMLSTHPDRRGERIALVLGAMALLDMHERFGCADFMTGVQAGNRPSEAICSRLGLSPDGMTTISVVDPRAIASGKLTS